MFTHFELLPDNPRVRRFEVRIFKNPEGCFIPSPLDPETGQPWKDYDSFHVLSIWDGVAGEISGAIQMKFDPLAAIRELGRMLKLKRMSYIRFRNGKKHRVVITL